MVLSFSPNRDAINNHYTVYLCGANLSYMINGGLLYTLMSLYSHMNNSLLFSSQAFLPIHHYSAKCCKC